MIRKLIVTIIIVALLTTSVFAATWPYQLEEWKDYHYQVQVWFNNPKISFVGYIVKIEGEWILLENSKHLCWIYILNVVGIEVKK